MGGAMAPSVQPKPTPRRKSEEQRRVAERRQRAADVAHEKDEEDEDVGLVACRSPLARISGRSSSMAAPVVPSRLASDGAERRGGRGWCRACRRGCRRRGCPPATTKSASSSRMKAQIFVRQRAEQSSAPAASGAAGGRVGQGEEQRPERPPPRPKRRSHRCAARGAASARSTGAGRRRAVPRRGTSRRRRGADSWGLARGRIARVSPMGGAGSTRRARMAGPAWAARDRMQHRPMPPTEDRHGRPAGRRLHGRVRAGPR